MSVRAAVDVPLAVVGADFRTASTQFREKLVTTADRRAALAEAMRRIDPTAGLVALETCNRSEWIVSTESPGWMADLFAARISGLWQEAFPGEPLLPSPSVFLGRGAVEHVFRVVVGLESLATGEAQIAGQFHDALLAARRESTISPVLARLASGAGRIAKFGSRVGFRSDHRQGIHGLATRFLTGGRAGVEGDLTVAVVGMGSIGRKVAQLLDETAGVRVIRANRTVRPEHLASVRPLSDLPAISRECGAVVVATGALEPVLRPEMVALEERAATLTILDIGIPRQTSPALAEDPRVAYRTIDDLLELPRSEGDPKVRAVLEGELAREVERFVASCRERDLVLLLDRIHQGRQEFATRRIPAAVEETLGDVDAGTRDRVATLMTKLLSDYSGEVHEALHRALDQSSDGRQDA